MIKKRNNSYGLNTNVHVDPSASANASPNITNHIYIRDVRKKKADSEISSPQQKGQSPWEQRPLSFNASAVSENNVLTRDIKLDDIEDEEQEQEQGSSNPGPEQVHVTTTPVKEPQKIYAREVIITTETNKQNEVQVKPKTAEQIILDTYAKILLDQNKALLLNLISKQTIIVPRSDLEQIIKAKVGLPCEVTLVDTDGGCCFAKYSPIKKVETIKIINEELVSDFKQVYNNDYNDLINLYHLCLRFCIDF